MRPPVRSAFLRLVGPRGHGRLPHQIEQLSAGETSFRTGQFENGEKLAMAQASASQPPQIKSRLAAILRSTSGNFLEQFDFFLFGFYAPYIAKAFFPSENETAALLNTFGVFWLGALMRPVGAIVLGAYIDRIGRRQGLIATLAIDPRGDPRLFAELNDAARHRRGMGLAHPVLHRLPHHSLHLPAAPDAGGNP